MLLIYEDGATYGLLIFCDYNKKQHLNWKQNPEKKTYNERQEAKKICKRWCKSDLDFEEF